MLQFRGPRLEIQVAFDSVAEGWNVPQVCDEYAASALNPEAAAEVSNWSGTLLLRN